MHRVMGVDIETYSSVDLTKAGVYAYVEAPDFDILLISYIFDDWGEDDVKTIDCFDADPDMMAEFCEALLDPQIVKTAFNANFERTCLAKWLRKPMPPEDAHDMALPFVSVIVTIVLLKEERICT